MRLLLLTLSTAHLAIDLTSSWTSPTPLIQQGKVLAEWKEPQALCTQPRYETDYIRWREFEVRSAEPAAVVEVSAEAGALAVSLSRTVLRLEGTTERFTLAYHCTDFNEGIHTVSLKLQVGEGSVSLSYQKVCGRPNIPSGDLSQVLQPLLRLVLVVGAVVWAGRNPSPSLLHLWSRKTALSVFACLGLSVLLASVEELRHLTGFIVAFLALWKGLEVTWKQLPACLQSEAGLSCLLFSNFSFLSLGCAVVAAAVALVYVLSQHWLLENCLACSLLFLLLFHFTVDCGKCCFSLLLLTFLYDVCCLFYFSVPNNGEVSKWLQQKCLWPLVLNFPSLQPSILKAPCTLIGFVDLLYPSFVLSFARRLDARQGSNYFKSLLITYSLCLFVHSFLQLLTQTSQPESLLINPVLVMTAAVVAAIKGDVLWRQRECEQ